MKIKELKPGTPIWVLWIDSLTVSSRWTFVEDIGKRIIPQEMRQRSIGFVTIVTDEAIMIHQSEMVRRYKNGDSLVDLVQAIPRIAIIRWGLLKEGVAQNE